MKAKCIPFALRESCLRGEGALDEFRGIEVAVRASEVRAM